MEEGGLSLAGCSDTQCTLHKQNTQSGRPVRLALRQAIITFTPVNLLLNTSQVHSYRGGWEKGGWGGMNKSYLMI